MDIELTGTKEVIFDFAVEMFALSGYEHVSMRDIAKKVGIKAASIYYHFSNKSDMLDSIYQYYFHHYFDNAKSPEELKALLDTGTPLEIINGFAWTFYGLPEKVHKRLTRITKIIYMRFMIDPKANSIFRDLMIGEMLNRKEPFEYAVSIGKLKPDVNFNAFCEVVLYVRLMTGIVGLADNYAGGIVDKKEYLNVLLAKMLEFFMTDS